MVLLNDIISSSNIIDLSIEDSEVSFPFADLIGSPDYSRPRSVFFATKDSTCTWYKEPFDRNYFIREISRKCPEWLVVTDLAKVKKANIRNFIVVQSVEQTLIRLIEKIPKIKKPEVIGITGSVGKSSLVNLLSSNLVQSRVIDAKRLTPLIVYDYYLNHLDEKVKYLIAEIGLFYSGQVGSLTDLLRPGISAITNIYDMHLYWNDIRSRSELLKEKTQVFRYANFKTVPERLYNQFPEFLSLIEDLTISKPVNYMKTYTGFELKTIVFQDQVSILHEIIKHCQPYSSDNLILENTSFKLRKVIKGNCELIIDNHCSLAGYFQALSEHQYKNCCLVIVSFNFVNEDVSENVFKIEKLITRFDAIYINIEIARIFSWAGRSNVYLVQKSQIIECADKYKTVIIHDPRRVLSI